LTRRPWQQLADLTALVILLVATACAAGAAELGTYWGNLEGPWRFSVDMEDTGEARDWHSSDFDDSAWRELKVPGYWEPQGVTDTHPGKPPTPKGRMAWTDYDGTAWYRLRFTVPGDWAGEDLVLHLGSVDDYDRTFFNGRLVGQTGSGVERAVLVPRSYTVLADAVKFGADNVLAVKVTDGGGPGGLMGPSVTLLPGSIAEAQMKLPQDDRPLAERFADPPAGARILKIVHALPDTPEAQGGGIRQLISQGFGGMATNVSFEGYVESEEKWEAFISGVTQAKEAGMSLWLYDELGYPSGTAGGITLRDHPEWEAQGLFIAEATSTGDTVTLQLPPGKLMSATAFPTKEGDIDPARAVDLAANVRDGVLTWQPAEGAWHVMAITQDRLFEGTHAAVSLHDNKPYINLLMAEPTARFLEVTHDEYARHLGDDLGEWFVSTFTDEPSLMSRFFKPMPYRVLPWSPGFAGEFQERRGYDIEPLIPTLVAHSAGCEKTRYDFWLTVAELVSENYFGQIQDWCREHNFASGGHLLLEEPIADHVPFYGDLMRCTRRLDAPSIDCLTSIPAEVPWHVARMAASAGELNGTSVTMCETSDHSQRYRPAGDTRPVRVVTEDEIRGTCNRLMLGGINTITSYYSFDGLDTQQMRRLNDWIGRCCTMLRGGRQVTELAVLYPVESIWPRFRPAKQGSTDSPEAIRVQTVFNTVSQSLFQAARDFTYIDSETIAGARVQDGRLGHRDLSWGVILLPCADTLPLAAWQRSREFWQQGGVIISLDSLPANTDTEFPSPDVQDIARELFGAGEGARVETNAAGGAGVFLPEGSATLLPTVLDSLVEPDIRASDAEAPIRVTHRRIDDHDIFFVINDSGEGFEDTLSVCADGPGELWDPASGEMTPLPAGGEVPVSLDAYGGVFLRYAAARMPRRLTMAEGRLPGLALSDLPLPAPGIGKGEFVEAELTTEERDDSVAWRATGTLTKSDVDTFLFLAFQCEEPVDLSNAECLVVTSEVPEGQETNARLLIILTDADGRQYVVDTGRALGAPGVRTHFVPLSSFQRAGWVEAPDGELDLKAITGISIGWGGYFGQEGETIELTLLPTQVATLNR